MGGRVEWTISGWMLDKISVLDSGELADGGVGSTRIVFWRLQEALDRQKYCLGGLQKAPGREK